MASMHTSMTPAHTRSQKPAYSGGSGVAASDLAFELERSAIVRAFSGDSVSRSPQNRQNLPSGKAELPQLLHTGWTATTIGREYYRRSKVNVKLNYARRLSGAGSTGTSTGRVKSASVSCTP